MPMVFTESPTSDKIVLIHNFPDQLTQTERDAGYEVTAADVEPPTTTEDERALPYFRNGAVVWEVETIPDPIRDRFTALETAVQGIKNRTAAVVTTANSDATAVRDAIVGPPV